MAEYRGASMEIPPVALNDRVIERGHQANGDVNGALKDRKMSPPGGEGNLAGQELGSDEKRNRASALMVG